MYYKLLLALVFCWFQLQTFGQVSIKTPYKCAHYLKKLNPQQNHSKVTQSQKVDIIHYNLVLDMTTNAYLTASAEIALVIKEDIANVEFDLLALTVDSVKIDGVGKPFSHVGELLTINNGSSLMAGNSHDILIYYQGVPQQDASGFGGFSFQGNYRYNLGVGFDADPHSFGRAWFPCFDNFIEKSTFNFNVKCDSSLTALCNGKIQSFVNNGDGTSNWIWSMDDPISSYLASIAVGPYEFLNSSHAGIPIQLCAEAADTQNLKQSFVNLNDCIDAFTTAYGNHGFNKIGYHAVPFNGGAMEHATDIAYPRFAIDGTTASEALMAHELAHHWWGDLVTCETQEDMWINEGWASYGVFTFYEHTYGKQRYKDEVRASQFQVIRTSHIRDGGYLPVSGIGHANTYGSTVYDKGALIAHSMRGYMEDEAFFNCTAGFLDQYKYSHASSEDFKNYLSGCDMDMNPFFKDWVFQPGFAHFSLDSFQNLSYDSNGVAMDYAAVYLRQKLNNAPTLFSNVPLELTFFGDNRQKFTKRIFMKDACAVAYVKNIGFKPIYVAVDLDEKLADSGLAEYKEITSTGSYQFEESTLRLAVSSIADSALFRVINNIVPPDPFKQAQTGIHLADRYWTIEGIFNDDFKATATFEYNGTASLAIGHLDNDFISTNEGEIRLYYRRNAQQDWQWLTASQAIYNIGGLNDKRGSIVVPNVQKGEYVMGIFHPARVDTVKYILPTTCTELNERPKPNTIATTGDIVIGPNPLVGNQIVISLGDFADEVTGYEIFSENGSRVLTQNLEQGANTVIYAQIDDLAAGVYLIRFLTSGDNVTRKIVRIR